MTVNYATGEIVNAPSYAEVRESIETTKSHLERAAEQVVWQIESKAWAVLGYSSWDEMREAEYKGAAVIVPRADQPELMNRLRSTGMSQRQIGDTIGVSESTVSRNLQMQDTQPETRTDSLGRQRPTTYSPKTPASTSGGEAAFDAGQTSESVLPETTSQGDVQLDADSEAAPMVGADDSSQEPTANAVAPATEPSPVGDYVEGSQDVQDARYLANFYSAVTKAHEFRRFDAERIGRIGDDDDMRTLELMAAGAAEFLEKAKRARSGLRVIKGGRA